MEERFGTMQGGGLAGILAIMGFSYLAGLALSASQTVAAWLGSLTPGQAALLGTIIVGVFGTLMRTGFDLLKWRYELRHQARARTKRHR